MSSGLHGRGMMKGYVNKPLAFEGYIDDFDTEVVSIQFSLDDGKTWTTYNMPNNDSSELKWQFVYTPKEPGYYLMKVRAVGPDELISDYETGFAFEVEPGE